MNKQILQFDFEIKNFGPDEDDDNFFRFEGLASTFGNTDLVNDVIEPGAFNESLDKRMPVLLFSHSMNEPIGMPEEIRETSEGLFLRGRLPREDTLVSGRVIPQMRVGSLKSMSIGFSMGADDFEMRDGKRFIKRVNLHEVSLVVFPANEMARVSGFKSELEEETDVVDEIARSTVQDAIKSPPKPIESLRNQNERSIVLVEDVKQADTPRKLEKLLREVGFSQGAAKLFVADTKESQRDVVDSLSETDINLIRQKVEGFVFNEIKL